MHYVEACQTYQQPTSHQSPPPPPRKAPSGTTPQAKDKPTRHEAGAETDSIVNYLPVKQGSKYFFLHGSCFVGLYKKVAPVNTISMELIFIQGGGGSFYTWATDISN